jgi:5-methylthioadenosine/S-adenosylhomocysteine deaminase
LADMIVTDGTVVTLDPERRVIDNGAVLIRGNIIEAVGDAEEINGGAGAIRVLDAKGKLVFPGLINTPWVVNVTPSSGWDNS